MCGKEASLGGACPEGLLSIPSSCEVRHTSCALLSHRTVTRQCPLSHSKASLEPVCWKLLKMIRVGHIAVFTQSDFKQLFMFYMHFEKSRKGIATPKEHLEMIERRLKQAAELDGRERKRPLR